MNMSNLPFAVRLNVENHNTDTTQSVVHFKCLPTARLEIRTFVFVCQRLRLRFTLHSISFRSVVCHAFIAVPQCENYLPWLCFEKESHETHLNCYMNITAPVCADNVSL